MKSWKIFTWIFRGTKTTKLLQKDQTDSERARNSCVRIILMLYTYLWSWLCMATLVPLPLPRAQIKHNCHKNWLNRNFFSQLCLNFATHHCFSPEMSERDVRGQEWGQIFHTHDLSQPRSGKCFQMVELQRNWFSSTNQQKQPKSG